MQLNRQKLQLYRQKLANYIDTPFGKSVFTHTKTCS